MRILLTIFCFFWVSSAVAGMPAPPQINLTALAKFRLDAISFFIFLILLSSYGIQLIWNYLARQFSSIPVINYKMAVLLIFLLGLLFNIVLVMIAGARELMTPGAWIENGAIYQLQESKPE